MGLEMSRMNNLTGWLHFKIRWTSFQQSLIAFPPSSDPLAISVKKGEIFGGSSWGGVPVWGGACIKLTFSCFYLTFYFMYMLLVLVLCFGYCCLYYGFTTLWLIVWFKLMDIFMSFEMCGTLVHIYIYIYIYKFIFSFYVLWVLYLCFVA